MEDPADRSNACASRCEQFSQRGEVWDEVGKSSSVFEGELQSAEVALEAVEFDRGRDALQRINYRDRICRRPQSHVPDDERFAGGFRPFREPLLSDMQKLRLMHGTDDRMEGLTKIEGPQTAGAGLYGDQFEFGGTCGKSHGPHRSL